MSDCDSAKLHSRTPNDTGTGTVAVLGTGTVAVLGTGTVAVLGTGTVAVLRTGTVAVLRTGTATLGTGTVDEKRNERKSLKLKGNPAQCGFYYGALL